MRLRRPACGMGSPALPGVKVGHQMARDKFGPVPSKVTDKSPHSPTPNPLITMAGNNIQRCLIGT